MSFSPFFPTSIRRSRSSASLWHCPGADAPFHGMTTTNRETSIGTLRADFVIVLFSFFPTGFHLFRRPAPTLDFFALCPSSRDDVVPLLVELARARTFPRVHHSMAPFLSTILFSIAQSFSLALSSEGTLERRGALALFSMLAYCSDGNRGASLLYSR